MEKITSCISSELDLFQEQEFQNIIRSSDYGYYGANLNISNQPIIEVAKSEKFLDLSKSFLAMTIKVYKLNGTTETPPASNDRVSIANNFIGTAFKQIQIKLDDTEIESSNSTYAIEDYIRRTLNESRDTKDTFLQNHLYYADSPSQFDNTEPNATVTTQQDAQKSESQTKIETRIVNQGFVARKQRILDGDGEIEIRGSIGSGLFHCGKLLLKQTKLSLVLTKNEDAFAIIGDTSFKFKFVKCGLWVKHVIPNDEIINSIYMRLPSSPIFYNTIRTKVSLISFEGKTDYFSAQINQDNIIPNRLIISFADTDAITTGNFAKNPFNFQNYKISEIDLREGTSQYPYSSALSFDFSKNKVLDGYYTLFNGIQKPSYDSHIDLNAYKNGYFFVVYDLRNSEDCPEYKELTRSGALNLFVKFQEPPNKPISIVCYQEFNQTIKIQVKEDGSKIISK